MEMNTFSKVQIGQRLKIVREILGKTPEQMAQIMKISVKFLKKIEQGKEKLPDSSFIELICSLPIDSHWLLYGKKPREGFEKDFDDLCELMQVPEVAEDINYKLKLSKIIFKDPITNMIKRGKNG